MTDKPKCQCWDNPQTATDREGQVDGLGQAFQHSIDMAVRDLNICDQACPYVAASAVAGLIFWVAYMLRGDGETPTAEQVSAAEAQVMALSRARLEGARMHDLDRLSSPTDAVH